LKYVEYTDEEIGASLRLLELVVKFFGLEHSANASFFAEKLKNARDVLEGAEEK